MHREEENNQILYLEETKTRKGEKKKEAQICDEYSRRPK